MHTPQPHAFLAALFRDRLLAEASPMWSELTTDYEDERNYLSLSLACERGSSHPVATVEFGVQDATNRHAVGIMLAHWRRAERQLGALETLVVDGEDCTLPTFMARLHGYLSLEQTHAETTDHAA